MEEQRSQRRTLQPLSDQRPDEVQSPRGGSLRQKLEARWQESRQTRSTARAPTPRTPRPKVQLRDGDVEAFKNLAHTIVTRTLARESEYRRQGYPELEPFDWKLVRRNNGLGVYQSRTHQERQPTSLCVGKIDGSLEDVLYGMHGKSRKEIRLADTFQTRSLVDCAVLAKIERGSNQDPFRQLSVKWLSTRTGDSTTVDVRDLCILESIGSGVDSHGDRFGYLLAKSVDLNDYPEVTVNNNLEHARMTMCCILREQASSSGVRVYATGLMDAGERSSNTAATCSMLLSLANATELAEAKRLTLLALQLSENALSATFSKLEASQLSEDSRVTEPTMASPISPTNSVTGLRESFRQKVARDPCHVCGRKPRLTKLVRAAYRTCGVCNQRVCHKCQVKRKVFARAKPVTISCCKVCIIASKRITVDPRDPCPTLP